MKKKLLFSLLLGSAFSWINEMHATAENSASVEEQSPALTTTDSAALAPALEIKTKIVNKGVLGEDITVKYHKEDPENILYDNIVVQDGGIVVGKKHNKPFIPGIAGTPKGYKMINIWFPITEKGNKTGWYGQYEEDFSKAIIQTENLDDFTQLPGYTSADEYMWMLMSDDNEIFIGKLVLDENAKDFYGEEKYDATRTKASLAFVRLFKLPNKEATAKLKEAKEELTELQEKLKSGAYTVAAEPGQSVNTDLRAATTSEGLLTKKFQFGDGIFEGKQMNLVCTTSDPKATQETFLKLVSKLLELFSTLPNVAVAMFSLALDDENSNNLRQIRISGEGISVNLMFSSEIDPQTARRYVEHLRSTTFSPDEMKSLQEKHNLAVKEYEAAMESMRLMQAQLDAAKELAAQALTAADEQKLEKAKADLEAENAKAILDATQNELILEKAAREQSEEEKLAAEKEAKQAAILAQKAEAEKLAAEEEAKQAAILAQKAEEEKLEAEKRLDKAHNAIIQVATAKTKDDNAMLSPTLLDTPAGDLPSQSNSSANNVTNVEQQQTLPLDNTAGDEVTKTITNGLATDDGTNIEQQQTLPLDNTAGDEVMNNGENLVPNPQTSVVDESTLKASVTSPLQQSLAPYLSKQTEAESAA